MGVTGWLAVVAVRGEWWALLTMSLCAVCGIEPLPAGAITLAVAYAGPTWVKGVQAWLLASAVQRHRLSRTWDGSVPALRHALGRLPAERHAPVLSVAMDEVREVLMGSKHLGRAALRRAASDAFAEPLLAEVRRFFLLTLQAPHAAEAHPPQLPWSIVYHQVADCANVEAGWQRDEDTPRLLPAWKAARLPREERPRESREPRRENERLLLCDACGEYRQLSGFYAFSLRAFSLDEEAPRVCRECLLLRASSESAGAQLREETSTALPLTFAHAALELLALKLLGTADRSGGPSRTIGGDRGAPAAAASIETAAAVVVPRAVRAARRGRAADGGLGGRMWRRLGAAVQASRWLLHFLLLGMWRGLWYKATRRAPPLPGTAASAQAQPRQSDGRGGGTAAAARGRGLELRLTD